MNADLPIIINVLSRWYGFPPSTSHVAVAVAVAKEHHR